MLERANSYLIISRGVASELVKEVNYYIVGGWQPLGGVAVVYCPDLYEYEYSQAMVKHEVMDVYPCKTIPFK